LFLYTGTRSLSPLMGQAPDATVFVALYSVVKYSRRLRDGFLATAVTLGGTVVAIHALDSHLPSHDLAVFDTEAVSVCAMVWSLGFTGRTRRLLIEGLRERAAAAERERDHLTQLAVAAERASIARELHDVIAHSLSVMIVQADGAQYALGCHGPEPVRTALHIVADTGRDALDEMRRLVDVLRSARDSGDDDRSRGGLDQLDVLLQHARAAGLTVDPTTTGQPRRLPAGVELAAYRIVQEAFTNVIKHAGARTRVSLQLTYTSEAIEIQVLDDGASRASSSTPVLAVPASPASRSRRVPRSGQGSASASASVGSSPVGAGILPSGGHGLVGLRERVSVYEGTFSAGPRPGGGWLVQAWIPIPVTRSPGSASTR
jgi:signal transduction histidine kinase